MATQVETFGDALVLDTFKHPGGINHAYAAIEREVGRFYGSTNTFRKLLLVESAEGLNELDQFRAWLLLAAYGKNPGDYGLSDSVVPPKLDAEELKKSLKPATSDYKSALREPISITDRPRRRNDSTGPKSRAA